MTRCGQSTSGRCFLAGSMREPLSCMGVIPITGRCECHLSAWTLCYLSSRLFTGLLARSAPWTSRDPTRGSGFVFSIGIPEPPLKLRFLEENRRGVEREPQNGSIEEEPSGREEEPLGEHGEEGTEVHRISEETIQAGGNEVLGRFNRGRSALALRDEGD